MCHLAVRSTVKNVVAAPLTRFDGLIPAAEEVLTGARARSGRFELAEVLACAAIKIFPISVQWRCELRLAMNKRKDLLGPALRAWAVRLFHGMALIPFMGTLFTGYAVIHVVLYWSWPSTACSLPCVGSGPGRGGFAPGAGAPGGGGGLSSICVWKALICSI